MRTRRRFEAVAAAVLGLGLLAGMGEGEKAVPRPPLTKEEEALLAKWKGRLDLPMVKYEWDRNAGDKSVPAELGGPGFTGEGWTTRLEFPTTSWPQAPKGGTIRLVIYDWPATLRILGENHNSTLNQTVEETCAEYLLGFSTVIMDYVPGLATHWWISPDRRTYRFRLNPSARWSDGTEVTAEDVVATWKAHTDPKMRYPSDLVVFGKFDPPVAKSKYLVEVVCKEENWRNFLYFSSGMAILPAKALSIPGDQYLDRYQNSYHPLSGAYTVLPEDIKMGQSLTLTRRRDYWDEKNPAGAGAFNFDKVIFEVVKDPNLAYEKAKKGELDFYTVPRALWWATEIPTFDSVKRGHLLMRKIYNDAPIGINGIAVNQLMKPLDDVRVRKALQLLFNRGLMIEKLCYNEYEPLTSYHQGGVYANPANREFPYDPEAASELLDQAGWSETNDQLVRVKDGREMKFELIYASSTSEKFLVLFQEDCRKAGVVIDLKLVTPASHWKSVTQKEFELADQPWTGLFFPNPETSWLSSLADEKSNNNITGFKDPRVDALCKEYDACYDMKRRQEIIREIDGILYAQHPYILMWFNPAQRFVYWNRFGMPPWGCGRTLRYDQVWYTMWADPAKEKALEVARASGASLPMEEEKNRFWQAWNLEQRLRGMDTTGGR